MFLRYLAPVFAPLRDLRNKAVKVDGVRGDLAVDVRRLGSYRARAAAQLGAVGVAPRAEGTTSAARASATTLAIGVDAAGHGAGRRLLAWLVPLGGSRRGELIALGARATLGSDADAEVALEDAYLSGRHAEIRIEGGAWCLVDLGSTNGSYVNDRRVERHELVDNDVVRVGRTVAKFKCL